MRAVLVPVKSFSHAKARLSAHLGTDERRALAERLAAHVLAAARPCPVYVVCDDAGVARWAGALGASVIWTPGRALSAAVAAGVTHVAGRGIDHVVVAHGDLPLASALATFGAAGVVTLAPDRHRDGTNVIALPAKAGFRFAYGPGSFRRHQHEAARLGLACHVVHEQRYALDIDVPEDLAELAATTGGALGWTEA